METESTVKKTRKRTMWIPDELWEVAVELARRERRSATSIFVLGAERYLRERGCLPRGDAER